MRKLLGYLLAIIAAFAVGNVLAFGTKTSDTLAKVVQQKAQLPAAQPVALKPIPAPIDVKGIEMAWRAWMERYGVSQASLAIGRGGNIARSVGVGRNPATSYPVASLSKSITALCLNSLLEESSYTWNSTLAELAPVLSNVNLTPAKPMQSKSLKDFATHQSGLPRRLHHAKTAIRKLHLDNQASMTRTALKVPANFNAEQGYTYSNANYAILGTVIAALSGQPYSEVCMDRIMTPAEAHNAVVGGRMARTIGYGGWSVSVEDYARFAMHWFDASRPWVQTPEDYTHNRRGGYGLGVGVQRVGDGHVFRHAGYWTHKIPILPNLGAIFIVGPNGTVAVVNWNGALEDGASDALLRTIFDRM